MSALHPGNLHGQGARSKTRYQYVRQRAQETQKVKEDVDTPKKEDPAPTPSGSNSTVIFVLVLMIGVTWGIAATSYFEVVDYRSLIDQCSAFFNEDPFPIIDKRRPVSVVPPARRLKRSLNLVTKDSMDTTAEPVKHPDIPQEKRDVDSGKKPEPAKTKQPEQKPAAEKKQKPEKFVKHKDEDKPSAAKDSEEKPKVVDERHEADKVKASDINLTLYLQLFVGNQQAISETHRISEDGTTIKIESFKDPLESGSLKEQIETCSSKQSGIGENVTESFLHDETYQHVTKVIPGPAPVTRVTKLTQNKHPIVRRLILGGSAVNKEGYVVEKENDQTQTQINSKVVTKTLPVESYNFLNQDANNSPKIDGYSAPNLYVIPTVSDPVVINGEKLELDSQNDLLSPHVCSKACILDIKFLNKKPEEEEGDFGEEGRLFVKDIILSKIYNLEQKIMKEREDIEKLFAKVSLPNPANRYFEEEREEKEGDLTIPWAKLTLRGPINKKLEDLKEENEDNGSAVSEFYTGLRVVLPNVVSKTLAGKLVNIENSVKKPKNILKCNGSQSSNKINHINTLNRDFSLKIEPVTELYFPMPTSPYKAVVQNCQVPYKTEALRNNILKDSDQETPKYGKVTINGNSINKPGSNLLHAHPKPNQRIGPDHAKHTQNPYPSVRDIRRHKKFIIPQSGTGMVVIKRGMSNPTGNKILFDRHQEKLAKVSGRGTASSRILRDIKNQIMYKTILLSSRVQSANPFVKSTIITRRNKKIPKIKRVYSNPKSRKSPKVRLKQAMSMVYHKALELSVNFATHIRNSDNFNRYFSYIQSKMPSGIQQMVHKPENSPTLARILDIIVNTTLNDTFRFTKSTGKKTWAILSKKSQNWFHRFSNKPSVKALMSKLVKLRLKLKTKFQKFTVFVKKYMIEHETNQKLIAIALLVLCVIGVYHILWSVFHRIFYPMGR